MTTRRQPAVFLDRDGTIIEDRGHLRAPADVVFFPDTVRALQRLQERFRLFIVTHQPGVSGGILTAGEVAQVNAHVVAELRRHGVVIDAVYCCPHRREDRCACIKPRPFFLEKAAREHGLDLTRSFVVGDHPHDVVLADHAGATGIYVLTGHGARHRAEMPLRQAVAPGIREAVDWIFACCALRELETRKPGALDRAAALLRSGGIVAFPTETVYGLGAAVFDETAVARVFEAKQRPRFDPLIVHVGGAADLPLLVQETPAMAQALIAHFWPGPLTLVLPKSPRVPDLVTAGLPTVAVRMPRHPLALALIARAGTPVAAPSANPFGCTSPTTAAHVRDYLDDRADMILDGGPCTVGVESTILSLATGRPVLLRPGGVPAEDLERVVGPVTQPPSCGGRGGVAAPGMLPRHYAPRTPLKLISADEALRPATAHARAGLLAFRAVPDPALFAAVEVLSENGDLREAAANLFSAMRRLDERHLDLILARPVPDAGLGMAINDRLARAAGRQKHENTEAT
jgi:L-threonylcarbamoyladenylate synthase